jgi:alpha-L-fucosidase
MTTIPGYLKDYEALYAESPRGAARAWFADAKFGLFMHYGLYSLLGRHEWVMYREAIPIAEYEALMDQFTAEQFDADMITDLALDAEMRYVTVTTRHHDSFCLFDSQASDYNSAQSAAGRDLIAELAEQCSAKGLGLFMYYSYAADWRHPYFYPRCIFRIARPDYPEPQPRYKWRQDADFGHYIDFCHAQLRELLTNYGPVAGIWLDPIMGYYARPDLFPIEETYALIRSLQP